MAANVHRTEFDSDNDSEYTPQPAGQLVMNSSYGALDEELSSSDDEP